MQNETLSHEITFKLINKGTGPDLKWDDQKIGEFLFTHLDQYGDKLEDIIKAVQYVFNPVKGGLVMLAIEHGEIVGAVIINDTGMSGYIPENILVYIAVHSNYRGKGLGKSLMEKAIQFTQGSIALHVEPDNPAKKLYESLGFASKYLEMRLIR